MFTKELIESLPIDTSKYYNDYVNSFLRLKWSTELETKKTVVEFRDCAEDLWESFSGQSLYADDLVKQLKTCTVSRKECTLNFLLPKALEKVVASMDYKKYHIDCEIKTYLHLVKTVNNFRPPLKASIQELEDVLKKFEEWKILDIDKVQQCMTALKLSSPWPILALWQTNENGEVDDIFLNVPMPRVFGAPSCVRNHLERKQDPHNFVKPSKEVMTIDNAVVCGHGNICFKSKSGWVLKEEDTAFLVAPLPGLHGHIFTLSPLTMRAAIIKLEPWTRVLEFDLPKDDEVPNWIDCQRDRESNLVLSWGLINSLTGALQNHYMTTMNEEGILGIGEVLAGSSEMQDRRVKGTKIDWRDHGNLLSVHHKVLETFKNNARDWTHQYDVVFANSVLMTLESASRPMEAVYGEPNNIFLLSPLSSSQTLQHWTLDKNGYTLLNTSSIPKSTNKNWTSLCLVR